MLTIFETICTVYLTKSSWFVVEVTIKGQILYDLISYPIINILKIL